MIALSSTQGRLVKVLPTAEDVYGYHPRFGWVSERAAKQRSTARKRHGYSTREASWLCRFRLNAQQGKEWSVHALDGCQVERASDGAWKIATPVGEYALAWAGAESAVAVPKLGITEDKKDRTLLWTALVALLMVATLALLPEKELAQAPPEILEPVTVKIQPEKQRTVALPSDVLKSLPKNVVQDQKLQRAVKQELGFLGLVGKKNLKGALGGVPTTLGEASPGAGAGGKEGSGGEFLVGLGQGVKRTTVGNTGVAGLGGVGTKGRGGGAGGYGNTLIGSGEGKALSTVALSQDMVLEGGLDRAVIQATIAKYISQVRACYEEGLRRNPGLAGQVGVNFEVGPGGGLNYANVGKSTLGDQKVEGCIAQRMMGWQFPKPLGGVNVKVNYPFLLRPVSS